MWYKFTANSFLCIVKKYFWYRWSGDGKRNSEQGARICMRSHAMVDQLDSITQKNIENIQTPDIAPSDFHLFPFLNRHLEGGVGREFKNNVTLQAEILKFLSSSPVSSYADGIWKLVVWCDKCLNCIGNYVEKLKKNSWNMCWIFSQTSALPLSRKKNRETYFWEDSHIWTVWMILWHARKFGRQFSSGKTQHHPNTEVIEAVHSALETDCWLAIWMLVEKLHMDKETVYKIITNDLGEKKLWTWFTPHVRTVEQRDCITSCQNLLEMSNNNPEFFK